MAIRSRNFVNAPFPNWTAIGVNWLAGFDFEIPNIVASGVPQYYSGCGDRKIRGSTGIGQAGRGHGNEA